MQFENIAAYKELDKILSIEGLDVIMLGPCDLASSMGHIGDWFNPEVEAVVDDVFERVHKGGKKMGVSIGLFGTDVIRRYQQRNVDMISVAADSDYIVAGGKQIYAQMQDIFLK